MDEPLIDIRIIQSWIEREVETAQYILDHWFDGREIPPGFSSPDAFRWIPPKED